MSECYKPASHGTGYAGFKSPPADQREVAMDDLDLPGMWEEADFIGPPDIHAGHPDAERCPLLHYWPPETADHNWTRR